MAWTVFKKSFEKVNKGNKKNVRKRKKPVVNLQETIIYDDSDENADPCMSFLEITPVKKRIVSLDETIIYDDSDENSEPCASFLEITRPEKRIVNLDKTIIDDDSDKNAEASASILEFTPQKKWKEYADLNITNIFQNENSKESNEIPDDLIELCSALPEDFNIVDSPTLKPLEFVNSNNIQKTVKKSFLKCSENLENSQKNWINLRKSFNINLESRNEHCTTRKSNILMNNSSSTNWENSEIIIEDVNSSQHSTNLGSEDFCFSSQLSLRQAINSSFSIECSNSSTRSKSVFQNDNLQSEMIEDGNTELDLFITEIQKDILNEKKIRAKKGGFVEKLNKILKSNQSDYNFWQNEIKNGLISELNLCCIQNIEKSYNNYIITANVNNKNNIKFCVNLDSKNKHLFYKGSKIKINFDFEPYEIDNSLIFVAVNKIAKQ